MIGFSNFLVAIAFWLGIFVTLATLALFGFILAIRFVHALRQRWRSRLIGRWRRLLAQALVEMPTAAPRITARQAEEVLPLWGYYQEFLRGDCRDNLVRLAQLAGLDLHAKRALRSSSTRARLVAIQVLGSLRDRESRRLLWPLVSDENPYLSLAAAHALLRISPRESAERIIPLLAQRPDWPPARVVAMLQEAGPSVVSRPLGETAIAADAAYQSLFVVYLVAATEQTALHAIKHILLQATDQQVIATCLHKLGQIVHPDSLKILRTFLTNPNWIIQLHAVSGIGKLGSEEDIPVLTRMLRHREFWVRYRAAQALASLPTMTPPRLAALRASVKDRFASDILDQVITEEAA